MALNRKQQIIDATKQILVTEGLKSVTLRRVAKEVGISAPSIYRHFKDRDALVRAVISEGSKVFASYLFRALESPSPIEQLAATGIQYLRFALDHEVVFGLMFAAWNELSIPKHSPIGASKTTSPGLEFLLDRVAACLPSTRPRDTLLEFALEQWALAHGLATLYLHAGGRQMYRREQYELMCARILRRAANKMGNEDGGIRQSEETHE